MHLSDKITDSLEMQKPEKHFFFNSSYLPLILFLNTRHNLNQTFKKVSKFGRLCLLDK